MSEQNSQKPMHSDIEFTNLGKINKANIKIRPFTVIAGCNSSGKSFITKSLYSLFSGVVGHSIETIITGYRDELNELLVRLNSLMMSSLKNDDYIKYRTAFSGDIDDLHQLDCINLNFAEAQKILRNIELHVESFNKYHIERNPIKEASHSSSKRVINYSWIKDLVLQFNSTLAQFSDFILNPEIEFVGAISDRLTESMSDNFIVSSTRQLVKFDRFDKKNDRAVISIDNGSGGSVFIDNEVRLNSDAVANIRSLNQHPPIYLESPVYWKLADALEESKKALSDTARRRQLDKNQLVSQVPKYFFDVMGLLDDQVKTTVFSDVVQIIEEAISGSLSINDGGIQYTDKASSASVSLSLTASGVTNLGMIALLLKRGAILPGTFFFIDEPEVHLHPAWQVVLIDVLHQLSKRGVNVVIASHSIDIMKAVENIMENDDEIDPQEHFGINQLTNDGYSVDVTDNNSKRIAAIKQDLGKPFYDMFLGA